MGDASAASGSAVGAVIMTEVWLPFQIHIPTRIGFGPGIRHQLATWVEGLGQKPFVVTGRRAQHDTAWLDTVMAPLTAHGMVPEVFSGIEPDPTDQAIIAAAQVMTQTGCDFVIAVGGGSVMDAAKAIAWVSRYGGSPLDAAGTEIQQPTCPVVCLPTTAGTGSEVTRFAVIRDAAMGKKVTMKNQAACPAVALVDPELTLTLPRYPTVCTAVDASIHALEAFLSLESQPWTDLLALEVLKRVFQDLPRVVMQPENIALRSSLQYAALLGGLVINTVRTGVIHTMANHLGAMTHLSHGHSLAVLVVPCVTFNAPACDHKLAQLQDHLGLPGRTSLEAVICGFQSLFALADLETFACPSPITAMQQQMMVQNVSKDTRLFEINPMPLTLDDVTRLYEEVLAHAPVR